MPCICETMNKIRCLNFFSIYFLNPLTFPDILHLIIGGCILKPFALFKNLEALVGPLAVEWSWKEKRKSSRWRCWKMLERANTARFMITFTFNTFKTVKCTLYKATLKFLSTIKCETYARVNSCLLMVKITRMQMMPSSCGHW